jgi:hypothetical protein
VKVAADREKTLRALSSTTEEPNTVSSTAIHFDKFARIEEINDNDYCMSVKMNYVGLEEVESLGEESGSDSSETLVPEPVSLQDFEDLARDYYDPEAMPWANQHLGCPLVEQVKYLLEAMRPYLGDPNWENKERERFGVYETSNERLCIMDSVTGEQELIPKRLAEQEDFLIGRWYAIKRTQDT